MTSVKPFTRSYFQKHLENIFSLTGTVDSLLFVGYQFSWISLVQANHEVRCSTNDKFYKDLYADFGKTTKLNIHEYVSFHESTKIGTHENKLIHSSSLIDYFQLNPQIHWQIFHAYSGRQKQ